MEDDAVGEAFSRAGGVRLGDFNASWPFARLSANREHIRLSCPGREYLFPRASVTRLCPHRGLLSVGLRLEHREARHPDVVVFWLKPLGGASGLRELESALKRLGYPVAA